MGLSMPVAVKAFIVVVAFIVLILGYFKITDPNSPTEELAEEVIKYETGVDIQLNKK